MKSIMESNYLMVNMSAETGTATTPLIADARIYDTPSIVVKIVNLQRYSIVVDMAYQCLSFFPDAASGIGGTATNDVVFVTQRSLASSQDTVDATKASAGGYASNLDLTTVITCTSPSAPIVRVDRVEGELADGGDVVEVYSPSLNPRLEYRGEFSGADPRTYASELIVIRFRSDDAGTANGLRFNIRCYDRFLPLGMFDEFGNAIADPEETAARQRAVALGIGLTLLALILCVFIVCCIMGRVKSSQRRQELLQMRATSPYHQSPTAVVFGSGNGSVEANDPSSHGPQRSTAEDILEDGSLVSLMQEEVRYENGVYRGSMRNGLKHGQGTYTWNTGQTFTGRWANDCMRGRGVYRWPDGRSYEGLFRDDKMHGHGKYSFGDGSYFEGAFANDLINGSGVFVTDRGVRHDVEWYEQDPTLAVFLIPSTAGTAGPSSGRVTLRTMLFHQRRGVVNGTAGAQQAPTGWATTGAEEDDGGLKRDYSMAMSVNEDPSQSSCILCLTYKPTYAMVPCGHVVLCSQCHSRFEPQKCPICRQHAHQSIGVTFLPPGFNRDRDTWDEVIEQETAKKKREGVSLPAKPAPSSGAAGVSRLRAMIRARRQLRARLSTLRSRMVAERDASSDANMCAKSKQSACIDTSDEELEEKDKGPANCIVCNASEAHHCPVPCGHVCLCADCVVAFCPACGRSCESIMEVFR